MAFAEWGDALGNLFARERLEEAQNLMAGLGFNPGTERAIGDTFFLSGARSAMLGATPARGSERTLASYAGRGAPARQAPASAASGPLVGDENWVFPVQGFTGKVNLHHGAHTGASDIFAPPGTPVVAARGGQVTGAGFDKTGGNYVSVRGDDGLEYYYAHLDRTPAVRAGQAITPGTYLGGVGDTGNARGTGAHLHFGAGRGIQTGVGPAGGAGIDYDTVAALQRALAGGTRPAPSVPSAPAGSYQQMAAEFAREAGIDPNTFVRQIQQESGFNPNARSPAGATGIAQIVPQYHPGVNPNDPEAALRYAAQLMAKNTAQYGDIRSALIAYNAGPGGLQRYQRTGVLPRETQLYLQRILGRS
jgi:murein DD-endopeptidase MepM/ murein hydrolase activator NlpD